MTASGDLERLFAGTALRAELERLARLVVRAADKCASRISAESLADDLLDRLHRSRKVRALRAEVSSLPETTRTDCVEVLATILRRRWGRA